MKQEFIELTLGSYVISHGYSPKNKEIMEPIPSEQFSKKKLLFPELNRLVKNIS